MRGAGYRPNITGCTPGITPAHAGSSGLQSPQHSRTGDHPRACGEQSASMSRRRCAAGSPPRMRGAASDGGVDHVLLGITPAHAGSSQGRAGGRRGDGDHPRACGEQIVGKVETKEVLGSPPRMRGAAHTHTPPSTVSGITPAHAGSRTIANRSMVLNWDHPRACGEQVNCGKVWVCALGSPPRMRGAAKWARTPQKRCGSPPRMRGAGSVNALSHITRRITPAHAGSRCWRSSWIRGGRDHPRACGEQSVLAWARSSRSGSPPRMRGAGSTVARSWFALRITPAHAGSRY